MEAQFFSQVAKLILTILLLGRKILYYGCHRPRQQACSEGKNTYTAMSSVNDIMKDFLFLSASASFRRMLLDMSLETISVEQTYDVT